jgi:hypothetical protein
MASPLLEQVKTQAQVLVPLLKALRAEFGAERVNRVAWKALEGWRRELVREMHAPFSGSPRARWAAGVADSMPRIGDAVDFEMLKQEPDAIEFNVTGCRFAQFFKELGEPELGFAMLCSFDTTAAEEIGRGEVQFKRSGTIMQGADHCDFRYALKKAGC